MEDPKLKRRDFLASIAMLGGLTAAYGSLLAIAGKFLYPQSDKTRWMYIAKVNSMKLGDSLVYQIPNGEKVAIARQKEQGKAEDFVALSSTCPHLGCQVHWQVQNNCFFCPCHNGVFDASGKGISGPPGDAGQSLPQYPLKIEKSLLYIQIRENT